MSTSPEAPRKSPAWAAYFGMIPDYGIEIDETLVEGPVFLWERLEERLLQAAPCCLRIAGRRQPPGGHLCAVRW